MIEPTRLARDKADTCKRELPALESDFQLRLKIGLILPISIMIKERI